MNSNKLTIILAGALAAGAATAAYTLWSKGSFRKRATAPANEFSDETEEIFIEPIAEEEENDREEVSEYTEGT